MRDASGAEWRNYFRAALTTSLAGEDSALVCVHALARVLTRFVPTNIVSGLPPIRLPRRNAAAGHLRVSGRPPKCRAPAVWRHDMHPVAGAIGPLFWHPGCFPVAERCLTCKVTTDRGRSLGRRAVRVVHAYARPGCRTPAQWDPDD